MICRRCDLLWTVSYFYVGGCCHLYAYRVCLAAAAAAAATMAMLITVATAALQHIATYHVLSGSISDVQLLCNLSYCQFVVYGHPLFVFVDVFVVFRCRWPAPAFVISDSPTHDYFETVVSFRASLPKHFFNSSNIAITLIWFLTHIFLIHFKNRRDAKSCSTVNAVTLTNVNR